MNRPTKIALVVALTVAFLLSCAVSSAYGRRILAASEAQTPSAWQSAARSHQ